MKAMKVCTKFHLAIHPCNSSWNILVWIKVVNRHCQIKYANTQISLNPHLVQHWQYPFLLMPHFLSFHRNVKVAFSTSGSAVPLPPSSHWLQTQAAGSAYECSNWRHSDLHGWTWWGRGTGQRDARHKLLEGWGCAKLHGGEVLIALVWPHTQREQKKSWRALLRSHS